MGKATGAVVPANEGNGPAATAGELAAIKRAEAAEGVIEKITATLTGASFALGHPEQDPAALVMVAVDRVAELEKQLAERGTELDNVRAELRSALEDLGKETARKEKAQRQARAAARPKSKNSKARKIGACDVDRDAVKAAMADASGEMEIVFSNGDREIIELEPLEVYPAAFRLSGGRFHLTEAVLVRGSQDGTRVRGVALLKGGEQIAYTGFPEPVKVPAGQEVKFDRMIHF